MHIENHGQAQVTGLLLHLVEGLIQLLHRGEHGQPQRLHHVSAIAEGEVAEVTDAVGVGVGPLVVVMGLEGVHMAVRRRIVDDFQRIHIVPELRAVLLDQLIPGIADVGILEALRQVIGEDDVAQLLGRQLHAQHLPVRALGHVQRHAGQAGDLLGDLVLAPGVNLVPVIVNVAGEGHRRGILFPGEVLPRSGRRLAFRCRLAFGSRSGGGFAIAASGCGAFGSRRGRCGRSVSAAAGCQPQREHHAQYQHSGKKSLLHWFLLMEFAGVPPAFCSQAFA